MEARKRLAIALAATTLGALVGASPALGACTGSDLVASAQSEAQLEGTILCLVNEQRAAAGAPPVSANPDLRSAALRHSAEMVNQGYFAHTSPTGVDFIDRIVDSGYVQGTRRWVLGENLVWGSGDLSSPAALVGSWMQSPPHRENLLGSRFRELGIAAVRGTPVDGADRAGVTVSSEYGYRANSKGTKCKQGKKGKKGKKAKKGKTRKRCNAERRHRKRG